jgi:hypothetical protein
MLDEATGSERIEIKDVEFSPDESKQRAINDKKYRNLMDHLDDLDKFPRTDDQILTDYWIAYLQACPISDDEMAKKIICDIAELSRRFNSSYPLSMLESYVGRYVRQSSSAEELRQMMLDARAFAPSYLWGAWDSFILETRPNR